MFLTKDEVFVATGKRQRSLQSQELTHLGIVHKIRSDGSILVLRAHFDEVMGLNFQTKMRKPVQIDWSHINDSV